MENVFAIMEERLAGIEELLNTVLARLDGLERPDEEVIGDLDDCSRWIKKSTSNSENHAAIWRLLADRCDCLFSHQRC